MLTQNQVARLRQRLTRLKTAASLVESDAHSCFQVENPLTLRADEICAAIQRFEWELERIGNGRKLPERENGADIFKKMREL